MLAALGVFTATEIATMTTVQHLGLASGSAAGLSLQENFDVLEQFRDIAFDAKKAQYESISAGDPQYQGWPF